MIVSRSPLRISLGGGGTDLPSYSNPYGGFVISAAIDKYVYVTVSKPFYEGIRLKYSEIENVQDVSQIRHGIIREALKIVDENIRKIEIASVADIPAGTGLGSSGSFTTALLKALMTHFNKPVHAQDIATLACEIELIKLKEPIGKQDQYIAAYGGITAFEFCKDGTVLQENLNLTSSTIHDLEDNLLLFYTGTSRSASLILKDQDDKTRMLNKQMVENLHYIKKLGYESKELLIAGDCIGFGELMNEHWEYKKSRSVGMTSERINLAYEKALKNGAIGGKLVGAGGGGFLLFYADDPELLRKCMQNEGMDEVRFKFDFQGTSVIVS